MKISKFGKDHWSTFCYVETRCVDYKGKIDNNHMRTDEDRHPKLNNGSHGKYPTILHSGEKLENHDDWDCLDDLAKHGFLTYMCIDRIAICSMTDLGHEVIVALRKHKCMGGTFSNFKWSKKSDDK